MRLAVALCLTLAAAIVEARPSTVPDQSSRLNVEQSIDNAVRARGLGDVLHNALDKHSSGSSGTSTVSTSSSTASSDTSTTTPVTTSSSSALATSSTSSPTLDGSSSSSGSTTSSILSQTPSPSSSLASSTLFSSAPTKSPSSSPVGLGSLLGGGSRHKDSEDIKAETYGNDKIATSRSLGTTGDRVGFRWVPVDSSD